MVAGACYKAGINLWHRGAQAGETLGTALRAGSRFEYRNKFRGEYMPPVR